MASSDSKRNDGDDLEDVEEEEEEEYEEIEEEIEVEEEVEVDEEEEVYEEVEEEVEEEEDDDDDEEYEEVEEEVEDEGKPVFEDEGKPEVEDEGKRKVREEIAEGKQVVEEVEEEEEEEYEEIEEEEYEEVEEEVEEEVTDDDVEEGDATMEEAEVDEKGDAEIFDVAKSDLLLPVIADGVRKDVVQDVEYEKVGHCLRSTHGILKTEAKGSILTNTSTSDVLCLNDESTSPKPNKDRKVISSIDIGSFQSPNVLEDANDLRNIKIDVLKDDQGNVEQTMMVSTSEKHASPPLEVASGGKLDKLRPSDFEEANFHFSSSQSGEHKESRVRHRSSSPDGEREKANKRSAIICEFFAKGWCIKGSSCRFLHKREHVDDIALVGQTFTPDKGKDIEMEHEEGFKLPKCEDKVKFALLDKKVPCSFVYVDGENSSSRNDGSRAISNSFSNPNEVEVEVSKDDSSMHQSYLPRRASSTRDLGIASSDCDSILRLLEESAAMRRHYSLDVHNSVPSYHFSSWKSSSLLHRFPSSSGTKPTSFSGSSYDIQDKLNSFQYKSTFTPYNWEPSVPFRSSYIIPPTRSSDIQYDPFRDSIEQPDVERASFKNSTYGHNQVVQRIPVRNSLEVYKGLRVGSWDKNYNAHENVIPEVEGESAATSASDAQNKKIVEEENPMIPGSVKDILKGGKSINDNSGSKLQSDLLRNGEVKVENGKKPNELDDEESKAIKYFRAALVEFVKELMKPIWHEGRLSKDVYKVIVQKAEDKILSTLQPNQVPNTSDSIKQYLSFSRPKILKLMQAYVDKYGKF